jgi:glycerol-1-phosphatase
MRRVATVMTTPLQRTSVPLANQYDVALLDLDGVVYIGSDAVPGAPESLAAVRAAGMRLAFVTNNAARPPSVVAEHLRRLGIPAEPTEVINSAQAAAHYLVDRLGVDARVLVVGTTGLYEALRERGLIPVRSADDDPAAVVQGYSPELDYAQLAEASVAIRRGLLWVATNVDPTVPSPRGPLPGNGSLVAALRHATGVEPVVTGKPEPTMHLESVERSGAQRPIVVGDRLDTDVEGANAAGCASLLVLTGVTAATDLLTAAPQLRPTYLAPDVSGLLSAHDSPVVSGGVARCGRWTAAPGPAESVVLSGATAHEDGGGARPSPDDLDPLRALCALAWSTDDASVLREHVARGAVRGSDEAATAALVALGLAD